MSDGTVELEVVLHLNIQGNLNLENGFLITLTSDIKFQQLVQDAHDVYFLVLRHKQSVIKSVLSVLSYWLGCESGRSQNSDFKLNQRGIEIKKRGI